MNCGRQIPDSLRLLICRIDVTALAAILFVLVTAFVVHPVAEHSNHGLPKAAQGGAMTGMLREDSLVVGVTPDDRVYLGTDRVDPEELSQGIHKGLSQGAEHKVYIRADKRARYGTIKNVLDGVREAGVEQIAFLVDGRSDGPR